MIPIRFSGIERLLDSQMQSSGRGSWAFLALGGIMFSGLHPMSIARPFFRAGAAGDVLALLEQKSGDCLAKHE